MSTINENIAEDGTVPIYDPDVIWDGPEAYSVYQVTEDIVLLQTEYSFKENVTLVFLNGAKIVCADPATGVTLIGNHTRIVAPPVQIFGDGVKAEGSWDIERAYPPNGLAILPRPTVLTISR